MAKLPYHWALDGISNTQTINPEALGHSEDERVENLVQVLDGYFDQGAHHLNVNVFGKEKLLDAMEHPEKEEYANFTIRVSGYAVKFIDLTREQQMDVISRTCHAAPVIPSAMSTRWNPSALWTAPVCALWCFCRGVPCGANTAITRKHGLRRAARNGLQTGCSSGSTATATTGAKKGGITVSGGEPLRQMEFLTAFFELARSKGVHTALDTAGQPFRPDDPDYLAGFDRLMKSTSLVILDLKEIDPERHRQLTGKDNANILAMARHLGPRHPAVDPACAGARPDRRRGGPAQDRRLYPQLENGAAGGGAALPHTGPVQVAEAGHPLIRCRTPCRPQRSR